MTRAHRKAVGKWRRWYFRGWIAMTIIVAALVAVFAPFTTDGPGGTTTVGVVIPPLLIIGVGFGIAWLAALILSRRNDPTTPDT